MKSSRMEYYQCNLGVEHWLDLIFVYYEEEDGMSYYPVYSAAK
jgi:hypothetical protein